MSTQMQGCDDLRAWLEANGFKTLVDHSKKPYNACNWYACRRTEIDSPECECNEGKPMQLVVWPFAMQINNLHNESVEVDVTGEADGVWYCLKGYAIDSKRFPDVLASVEKSLIAAWSALYRPEKVGAP